MFLPFTEGNELKSCGFPFGFWLLNSSDLWVVVVMSQLETGWRVDFVLFCRAENEPTLRLSNGITLAVGFQHYVR